MSASKSTIDANLLRRIPLAGIDRVVVYKRDEITTDLICCAVEFDGNTWTFHEEMTGWDLLLGHLRTLPGFRTDWLAAVAQPPFATNETLAFRRL